ncbi:two-partner secretion domain-containing protein [Yersinia artesiana]|uniref:two-partner secretion domain-containing protein n=1 Tax=Yersinia artesiana TaxID=2890315 RepID=UPI00158243C1|nr:filamentous hemagglutinin N-terminal domain-containing protein [Yersinia artesiana]
MVNLCFYYQFNLKNHTKILYCFLFVCPFYLTIQFSYAEIVVDVNAPLHQRPAVSSVYIKGSQAHCKALNAYCRGANYTTINIQIPNEQGVSHNKYIKFDVEKGAGYDKVSLNNFIASSVTGNPNLTTVVAKVILNEITSGYQTRLDGPLIVAGEKAYVIIANPAGIHCNGCHFINTNHVTLTTGLPIYSNGYIRGYNVIEGAIDIGNRGLLLDDETNVYLDIFSRSLNVEGGVRAKDILFIVGKNAISYAPIGGLVNATSLVGFSTKDKNNVGLDVNHLGGMYANKIFIFSRDGGVINSGVIHADKKINIISNRFIKNNGRISAEDVTLQSMASVDNQLGSIKNIKNSIGINADENAGIKIVSKFFNNNKGYIYSNVGDVSIEASNRLYNGYGVIRTIGTYGQADIKIKTKKFNNFSGVITTSNNIVIDTDILKNNEGRIVSAFGTLDLRYRTLEDKDGLLHGGLEVMKLPK